MDVLLKKLTETRIHEEPFPHMFIESILDKDDYKRADHYFFRSMKPFYPVIKEVHKNRLFGEWDFDNTVLSFWHLEHLQALVGKFGVNVRDGVQQGWCVQMDQPGYQLLPHLDDKDQLISLIFYMGKSGKTGTTLYTPKRPVIWDNAHRHFPFERFKEAETVPFKPNSAFAFAWSPDSWHGVKPVTQRRETLTWVLKGVRPQ